MPTSHLSPLRWLLSLFLVSSVLPAVAANSADAMADADTDALTEALARRRLAQEDLAPYHRLDVSIYEGVATLTGSVRTKTTRDAVLREVGKVAGVERVEDRVKVEPNP